MALLVITDFVKLSVSCDFIFLFSLLRFTLLPLPHILNVDHDVW